MFFFFFKQKTAYEMRISDWSSDVCSSDLDVRQLEAIMRDRSVSSSKPRSNFSSLNVKTRYRRVHSSIGASIVDPSKTAFFLNTEVASMHLWQSYSLAWATPNSAPKNCASRLRSDAPHN